MTDLLETKKWEPGDECEARTCYGNGSYGPWEPTTIQRDTKEGGWIAFGYLFISDQLADKCIRPRPIPPAVEPPATEPKPDPHERVFGIDAKPVAVEWPRYESEDEIKDRIADIKDREQDLFTRLREASTNRSDPAVDASYRILDKIKAGRARIADLESFLAARATGTGEVKQ